MHFPIMFQLCAFICFSSPSQSTICTHMMMLTIHTFMAIITADNYMDETFFLAIVSRLLLLLHLVLFCTQTHILDCAEEEKSQRKEISKRYNWRQNTEFIYDKPRSLSGEGSKKRSELFHLKLLRCLSFLEVTGKTLLDINYHFAESFAVRDFVKKAIHCSHRNIFLWSPRGSSRGNTHKKRWEAIKIIFNFHQIMMPVNDAN